MNGEDLISLAGALVANRALGNAEARYRSAVSRAYYGAFHLAAALLVECGATLRKSADCHNDVYFSLLESGHATAQHAARLLSDLRADRNRADYQLDDVKFSREANAKECVETAYDVKRLLEECRIDPQAVEAIRRGFETWRLRAKR